MHLLRYTVNVTLPPTTTTNTSPSKPHSPQHATRAHHKHTKKTHTQPKRRGYDQITKRRITVGTRAKGVMAPFVQKETASASFATTQTYKHTHTRKMDPQPTGERGKASPLKPSYTHVCSLSNGCYLIVRQAGARTGLTRDEEGKGSLGIGFALARTTVA